MMEKGITTTSLFPALLASLEEGNGDKVKESCFKLFNDFSNLVYLRDQFGEVSHLVMLYLDDSDVIKLIEILTRYFKTEPSGYASGYPSLDDNGGNELRARNLKKDVLAIFKEVTGFIKDSGLRAQQEEVLKQMQTPS